jgi:hypothetical protein
MTHKCPYGGTGRSTGNSRLTSVAKKDRGRPAKRKEFVTMPKGEFKKVPSKETNQSQRVQEVQETQNATSTSRWENITNRLRGVKDLPSKIDEERINEKIVAIDKGTYNAYEVARKNLLSEYESLLNESGAHEEEIKESYAEQTEKIRILRASQRKQLNDAITSSHAEARRRFAYSGEKKFDRATRMYYLETQYLGERLTDKDMEAKQKKEWEDMAKKQEERVASFKATLREKSAKDVENVDEGDAAKPLLEAKNKGRAENPFEDPDESDDPYKSDSDGSDSDGSDSDGSDSDGSDDAKPLLEAKLNKQSDSFSW